MEYYWIFSHPRLIGGEQFSNKSNCLYNSQMVTRTTPVLKCVHYVCMEEEYVVCQVWRRKCQQFAYSPVSGFETVKLVKEQEKF